MDSLSIMLGLQRPGVGGGASDPLIAGRRNNVEEGALRAMLGLAPERYMRSVNPHDPFSAQVEDTYDYTGSQQDTSDAAARMQDLQSEMLMDEAQAKSLPERLRGEYGLREQILQNTGNLDVAHVNREAAASQAEAMREFNAMQGQLNRDAAYGRAQLTQGGLNTRSANIESGKNNRQMINDANNRARLLETGKAHAPAPDGWWDKLFGPTQKARDAAAAQKIRQEAMTAGSAPGIDEVASRYLQQYPSASPDQLRGIIAREHQNATPQDIEDLLQLMAQMRGQ